MFRRRWSALPADPVYPSDMKQLGYFINNVDEIRSIDDPNKYFKYFLTKNARWNERQRFAMNEAIESEVHSRLEALGLKKTILPADTPTSSPHVPVFISSNIQTANRIIVLFGEAAQDLGIIAHRVIGGPGGVTKGSMVSIVQAIRELKVCSEIGIVIANPGQLWWWPEGKRGLTLSGRFAIPMQSAVHLGRPYNARLNAIPGHETVGRHVESVFEEVLDRMTRRDAKLAVVAVTDAADEVERYLDDEDHWTLWGPRMESLSLLGNFYGVTEAIKCEGFRTFLTERGRHWIGDPAPLDAPLANSEGTASRPGIGCPVLSAGPEAYLAELLLIYAYPAVLKFICEVAAAEDFSNPRYAIDEPAPEPDEARYWKEYADKEDDDVWSPGKAAHDKDDAAGGGESDGDEVTREKAQQPDERADISGLRACKYPERSDMTHFNDGTNPMAVPTTVDADTSANNGDVTHGLDRAQPATFKRHASPTLDDAKLDSSGPVSEKIKTYIVNNGQLSAIATNKAVFNHVHQPTVGLVADMNTGDTIDALSTKMSELAVEAATHQTNGTER